MERQDPRRQVEGIMDIIEVIITNMPRAISRTTIASTATYTSNHSPDSATNHPLIVILVNSNLNNRQKRVFTKIIITRITMKVIEIIVIILITIQAVADIQVVSLIINKTCLRAMCASAVKSQVIISENVPKMETHITIHVRNGVFPYSISGEHS